MRFAVLVSGSGSNLQALIDAERSGALEPGRIALVVSNRADAHALERARAAAIDRAVVDHRAFASRREFEAALLELFAAHRCEGVILAGFLRVLTAHFVDHFPERILNTHPALCPAFPGLDAPAQALAHGVKVTGCTVHLVDSGVDTGPIVFQETVAVAADDTPATLHERIKVLEHQLLPRAAQHLAAGRLLVRGRRVDIL